MGNLKTLVLDIETSPMLAWVWGRQDQNIAVNQVKQDWYVMAWSAKWLGDPVSKVMYFDQRNIRPMENDKAILGPMRDLLDEAHIVVTQNGKHFDSKKLNARFIMHGMTPPSPYRHWDTMLVARSVAAFTSNSLEYLTEHLCTKYKKLSHSKFPGMSLWLECLAGNQAAWDDMRKYNIHDVLSTEELYTKLRPWAPQITPAVYLTDDVATKCPKCPAKGTMRPRGYGYSQTLPYPKYYCEPKRGGCGGWTRGANIRIKKGDK